MHYTHYMHYIHTYIQTYRQTEQNRTLLRSYYTNKAKNTYTLTLHYTTLHYITLHINHSKQYTQYIQNIHTYIHTYKHTYTNRRAHTHTNTIHYIAVHYKTKQYHTYNTWHYSALQYITSHIAVHYITYIHIIRRALHIIYYRYFFKPYVFMGIRRLCSKRSEMENLVGISPQPSVVHYSACVLAMFATHAWPETAARHFRAFRDDKAARFGHKPLKQSPSKNIRISIKCWSGPGQQIQHPGTLVSLNMHQVSKAWALLTLAFSSLSRVWSLGWSRGHNPLKQPRVTRFTGHGWQNWQIIRGSLPGTTNMGAHTTPTCSIPPMDELQSFLVPQTVWTHLGVLTVVEKQLCLDRWGARAWRLIRCYLQYIHAFQNPQSAFRLRRLAKSAWALWRRAHFCKGSLVQGIGAVLLRNAVFMAGAALLDMAVIVKELGFRDRCGESWLLDIVARLQISWQAQHSVTLDVHISWQMQHFANFANLEVQFSGQVQYFVNRSADFGWFRRRLTLSLSLSPSLSLTHTRSHSHSLFTHTHIHMHSHSHSHSLSLTLALTLTHTHTPSHPHSHSLSSTLTHTHLHFITTITSLDPNASRSLDFLLIDLTHTVWGLLPG